MGDKTHIQWTDATWNPIAGCSIRSAGCTNCYAMALAGTRLADHPMYSGTTKKVNGRHVFNGALKEAAAGHPVWDWPMRFRGPKVTRRGEGFRPLVFVGDMSDLFHEDRDVGSIDKVWARMALSQHLEFQVLTKRPDVMRDYLNSATAPGRIWFQIGQATNDQEKMKAAWALLNAPLPNVWVGTSTENQAAADERIPILLQVPAAVRYISAEPLIGEIDLRGLNLISDRPSNALSGAYAVADDTPAGFHNEYGNKLDLVIVGGESGNYARDSVVGYQRSLIQQCQAAGVAVFEKQLGAKPVNREGQRHAITDRAGGEIAEFPPDLQVRQWPARVAA